MSEQNQQPEVAAEEQQEAVLQIQRIYVKDVSFEAPNLPHIFHQEWKPKLGFDLSTEAVQVGEDFIRSHVKHQRRNHHGRFW